MKENISVKLHEYRHRYVNHKELKRTFKNYISNDNCSECSIFFMFFFLFLLMTL